MNMKYSLSPEAVVGAFLVASSHTLKRLKRSGTSWGTEGVSQAMGEEEGKVYFLLNPSKACVKPQRRVVG